MHGLVARDKPLTLYVYKCFINAYCIFYEPTLNLGSIKFVCNFVLDTRRRLCAILKDAIKGGVVPKIAISQNWS